MREIKKNPIPCFGIGLLVNQTVYFLGLLFFIRGYKGDSTHHTSVWWVGTDLDNIFALETQRYMTQFHFSLLSLSLWGLGDFGLALHLQTALLLT